MFQIGDRRWLSANSDSLLREVCYSPLRGGSSYWALVPADAINFLNNSAVSSCTSIRCPPRLLPPALPSAESITVLPWLSLAFRSAPRATRSSTAAFHPQNDAPCSGV